MTEERRLRGRWRAAVFLSAQALLLYGACQVALREPAPAPPDSTDREAIEVLRRRGLQVPVSGIDRQDLRSSFGAPRGARKHLGIDILAPAGRPVIAVEAGRIVRLADGRLSGKALHLASAAEDAVYFYAHLRGYVRGLKEGQTVRAGAVLGYVGTTGNATTPHLHFGLRLTAPGRWQSGRAIDPYLVLRP